MSLHISQKNTHTQASTPLTDPPSQIDVYLVNGKSISVTVAVGDRADQVLEAVCDKIDLNSDLTYYFGLFLERVSDNVCEFSILVR